MVGAVEEEVVLLLKCFIFKNSKSNRFVPHQSFRFSKHEGLPNNDKAISIFDVWICWQIVLASSFRFGWPCALQSRKGGRGKRERGGEGDYGFRKDARAHLRFFRN